VNPLSDGFSFLRKTVESAVAAVFAEQGLDIKLGPPCRGAPAASESYLAMIGFAGETLSGAVSLLACAEVVSSILPGGLDPSPALLADYLGEVANMTAGRVKHHLLRCDVHVLLATPLCATGMNVGIPSSLQGQSVWLGYESRCGPVFVKIDALLALDFKWSEASPEPVLLDEGDAIFF
jgi:CheY-specific phosphatase CheX